MQFCDRLEVFPRRHGKGLWMGVPITAVVEVTLALLSYLPLRRGRRRPVPEARPKVAVVRPGGEHYVKHRIVELGKELTAGFAFPPTRLPMSMHVLDNRRPQH